ncbi:MAG: NifB/NifX family molybdenum-iron cluster-binding protein [Ethanoligenens sp.]
MAFRVAAASSDGIAINLHFGQAHTLYIYELTENAAWLVEKRNMFLTEGHRVDKFQNLSAALKDCDALLVSQIGPTAAQYILGTGLRVFEAPYPIEPVLEKLRVEVLHWENVHPKQRC